MMDKVWPALIGAVAGVTVAFFAFKGTETTADAKVLDSLIGRVNTLEKSLERKDAEIMALNLKLLEVKAESLSNMTKKDLFQEYINTLPFPAWIKAYDPERDVFIMVMINYSYASKFGVSKLQYEGSTDREVGWSAEVSAQFEANDRLVMATRGYVKTKEKFPKTPYSTKLVEYTVWKFSVRLGEERLGVGGMITE